MKCSIHLIYKIIQVRYHEVEILAICILNKYIEQNDSRDLLKTRCLSTLLKQIYCLALWLSTMYLFESIYPPISAKQLIYLEFTKPEVPLEILI